MNKITTVFWATAFLSACSHTVCGTYQGTLPAASGPGIETTLTLEKNGIYNLKSVYLDEDDGVFDEVGTYYVEDDVITLNSPQVEAVYFKLEDNQVRRLDHRRQQIIGNMADYYILKKTKSCR